ncbi:MAG: replicative DNA helicase [Clostridia bacterium]|nr:replicative DNA helicase [Clostridia bacterium]
MPSNESIMRVLPNDVEAEQAVLCCMLIDKDAVTSAIEILKADDFYREDNKEIFSAITDLFERSAPIDLVSLNEQLRLRGTLDAVGGIEYIADLSLKVATSANIEYYAKLVEEKSILRKLIRSSTDIVNMGYTAAEDVQTIVDTAEKKIFDIVQKRNVKGFTPIKNILISNFEKLEELYNQKGFLTGISYGFKDLDMKTAGLHNSDLVLIAARPAMGKSAFGLNIAQHAAVHSKIPVAIFSLEMSKEQIVNRMLCCEAMIDANKMRTGKLEEDDWGKVAEAMSTLSDAPIYIDDNPGQTVMDIRAKCRRLKLEKGLGLIVIDYLQLMQGPSRRNGENRQQEVSDISRALKIMAKELDVPVITLSQLSRAPDARPDHRPVLSDLRESGAIEQDADIVMFLYRDDYYNPETEKKNISEVILAKHRGGSTGTVELVWLGQYTKFANKFNG